MKKALLLGVVLLVAGAFAVEGTYTAEEAPPIPFVIHVDTL